jgi:hypothetical protein
LGFILEDIRYSILRFAEHPESETASQSKYSIPFSAFSDLSHGARRSPRVCAVTGPVPAGLKKMCLSADNRQVDRLPPSRVTADLY